MKKPALLILADGTVFPGVSFGGPAVILEELVPNTPAPRGTGEVVFNTGMAGYHEILTDPSYTGQIVTMTYPLIGNYGSDPGWNEGGPEKGISRPAVKAAGFVVRDLYDGPVPLGRITVDEFLRNQGVPGITGVDTRRLTLRLRDGGTPSGLIIGLPEGCRDFSSKHIDRAVAYLSTFPSMEGRNLLGEVGTRGAETVNRKGSRHMVLIDCGAKRGILREMEALDIRISVLPSTVGMGEVLNLKPEGVLFSNGPGDPSVLEHQIRLASKLMERVPVFGICLGHQIIALALGAKTYKLPFGHHGVNNPVVNLRDHRVYVTSQNHGFAVDESTLPEGAAVWFKNANDATVEGLYHETKPIMSVQFHPEACPGPHDTRWIIGEFVERMKTA